MSRLMVLLLKTSTGSRPTIPTRGRCVGLIRAGENLVSKDLAVIVNQGQCYQSRRGSGPNSLDTMIRSNVRILNIVGGELTQIKVQFYERLGFRARGEINLVRTITECAMTILTKETTLE
jgi:hypothetical protein